MARRTAAQPPVGIPDPIAIANGAFVGNDGEAHDAELERRWASVHGGLVAVLASLDETNSGTGAGANVDGAGAACRPGGRQKTGGVSDGRALKRRRKTVDPKAWCDVYADVHKLFEHRDPRKKRRMYDRVREFLKEYVREQLVALRARLADDSLTFLKEYNRRWDKSVQFVKSMKRMLHHLQHYWIPMNSNVSKDNPVRPLDRLMMFYWREELLAKLPELVSIILSMIDDDRLGKPIDHAPLKSAIDTLVVLGATDTSSPQERQQIPGAPPRRPRPFPRARNEAIGGSLGASPFAGTFLDDYSDDDFEKPDDCESLHFYLQVFEDEFLKRTAAFYSEEADKMMHGNCVSSFMREVVGRLDEEIARGERLLHMDSVVRLRSTVEEKLVGAHMAYLQGEADAMVRGGKEEDLKMVFKLLERLKGGLTPIRDYLTKYIVEEGIEMMTSRAIGLSSKEDTKKSLVVVEDLIDLHKLRTAMILRCLGGAQVFVKALDDAFGTFMNRPIGALMMAEVLACYADFLLRNPRTSLVATTKNSTEEGIDRTMRDGPGDAESVGLQKDACLDSPVVQQMDRIIRLFLYVDDKDMFHETYRRLLAKRLLSGKHDDVLEEEFIAKLKIETGPVYTGKLSGMFKDVVISNEERQKFRSICDSRCGLTPSAGGRRNDSATIDGEGLVGASCETDAGAVSLSCKTGAFGGIEFGAHVLNALHWPAVQEDHLAIPRPLLRWQKTFASFYMRNKESRKITWIHSQSTNHVAAELNGKKYTLVVSTFQACVLLEFNDTTRRSLADLARALNVQPSILSRHMQPLVANKKSPILTCDGEPLKVPVDLTGYGNRSAAIGRAEEEIEPFFETSREIQNSGAPGPEAREENDNGNNAQAVEETEADSQAVHNEILAHIDAVETVEAAEAVAEGPVSFVVGDLIPHFEEGAGPSAGGAGPLGPLGAHQVGNGNNDGDRSPEGPVAGVGFVDENNNENENIEATAAQPPSHPLLPGPASLLAQEPPTSWRQEAAAAAASGLSLLVSAASPLPATAAGLHLQVGSAEDAGCLSGSAPEGAESEGGFDEVAPRDVAVGGSGDDSENAASRIDDDAGNVWYDLVPNFSSRTVRVVYPAMTSRVTTKEAAKARHSVVVDRNSMIDAVLVRVMKQRKTLAYQQLVAEVMSQVSGSFKPDARAVKGRLEQLIEREFIERSPDDPGLYHYAA